MIHTRSDQWNEMPFASMHELADFAEELDRIVKEAVPEPPREVKVHVQYAHGKTGYLSAEEFRRASPELGPLSEAERVYVASGFVDEDDPAAKSDNSAFTASLFLEPGDYFYGHLSVDGRKVTTVEGVRGAAKAAVEKHAAKKRQEDELAAQDSLRKEEEDRERERQAEVASAILRVDRERARERDGSPPRQSLEGQRQKARGDIQAPRKSPLAARFKRFAYDPWTIGVGTAVIGGVVLAVFLR